jgi:hypothetical protein
MPCPLRAELARFRQRAVELCVPAQKLIAKYGEGVPTRDGWKVIARLGGLTLSLTTNTKRRTRDLWIHTLGAEALRSPTAFR